MKKKIQFPRLTRRTLLRSAGVSALAYPFLRQVNLPAKAQGDVPKRLLLVFSPNGTPPAEWGASGSGANFELKRTLQPLNPMKSKISVIEGCEIRRDGPGDNHQRGMGGLWTGQSLNPGDTKGGGGASPVSFANGASIDQHLAERLQGNPGRRRSLELAVNPSNDVNVWTRMIYDGPNRVRPPISDPYQTFTRLFSDLPDPMMPPPVDNSAAEHRFMMEKSLLDGVMQDFAELKRRLGRQEQALLDNHLTSLRTIEQSLQSPDAGMVMQPPSTCEAPGEPARMNVTALNNFPELIRLQTDMMAMAFACDITRVGSLQWSRSVSNMPSPWLNISERHHSLSHDADNNAGARDKIVRIHQWYIEQFLYLIQSLDGIPEGDGTVLDNTLVVFGNELGAGTRHSLKNMPIVVAGGGNIGFKTGQHINIGNGTINDLLMTIAHGFGDPVDSFGRRDWSNGVISDMLA